MADGASATLANSILNHLTGGTAWTQPPAPFAELHIGTPGAAGTSNPSAGSTQRFQLAYGAAANGSVSTTANAGPFTNTAGTETLSDMAFWTAASAGIFEWSAQMNSTHIWNLNDTFTLTSATVSITPLAA